MPNIAIITIIETNTGFEIQIAADPISPDNNAGVVAIAMTQLFKEQFESNQGRLHSTDGGNMDTGSKTQYTAPPSFNLPSAIAQVINEMRDASMISMVKALTTPSKEKTSDERSYSG
jgi:hypothetical protein